MGKSNIATALNSIIEKVEEAKLKRNMPPQGCGPNVMAVSGSPHSDQLSKTNLFIQGLDEDINDMDLLMLCSAYGQIISAKAIMDKQTNKCKGYGFVDFESPVAAEIAVKALAKQGVQAQMAKVHDVCIVAVSKTKPKSVIIEAYNCGHRDFGENYVNELFEKASDAELLELCPDIRWHFIGHLQSNKVNKLMGVPNLYMLHTVDSVKLADLVDRAWSKLQKPEPLKIMIQVNTSGEESKSGISPDVVLDLAKHIIENCKHVHLAGLMLIGYANYDLTLGPNPEFQLLSKCKISICEKFNINPEDLGLSMGMSQDFEHAVELGSNYVRVGSLIFGAREKNVSTQ